MLYPPQNKLNIHSVLLVGMCGLEAKLFAHVAAGRITALINVT
jgi:hypothetical protein